MSKTEIFYNLEFAAYRDMLGLNYSLLKHMDISPLAFKHALEHGRSDTTALAFGRIVHMAVLEHRTFVDSVAVWREGSRRTKAYKEFAESMAALGKQVITAAEEDQALSMCDAVYAHGAAGDILGGGKAEVSISTEHESGRMLKCRADYLGPGRLVDLKTTGRPIGQFEREIRRYGYHIQCAFYRMVWALATGEDVDCYLVAVEKAAPHDVGVFQIPEAALDEGRDIIDGWLDKLSDCEAYGIWPGAMPGIKVMDWAPSEVVLSIDGEDVAV